MKWSFKKVVGLKFIPKWVNLTFALSLFIYLYEARIIWWKESQMWFKIFDNDFIVVATSRHQWQSNQCEQQIKVRSNHSILFFDNLCLLKDSMKETITLDWPCLDCCQWTMFPFLFHRSIFNMQNTHVSNP
jgi:hypothetical protein